MSQTVNPDPDLMRIFDFTPVDLESNRVGKLTERQIKKLSAKVKKERLSNVIGVLVICIVMLIIIISNYSSQIELHKMEGWGLLALFFLVMVLLGNYVSGSSLTSDVRSGTVRSAQGTVKRWNDHGRGTLKIGGEWLDLDHEENNSLKIYLQKIPKGTKFRVNYVHKSNRVMSMEIIE